MGAYRGAMSGTTPAHPDEKIMRLRYAGRCRVCAIELPARMTAVYERTTKTVRCRECPPGLAVASEPDPVVATDQPAVDPPSPVYTHGTAGASARREFERRSRRRRERQLLRRPKTGRMALALSAEPQHIRAWDLGARGEEDLGAGLDARSSLELRVLHDRRIPGSRANIDHLLVTPAGVWVVDAKRYRRQRPRKRVDGGLFRTRVERLLVGRRDRTALVTGLEGQVAAVRDQIADLGEVPVRGWICFLEADWPFFGGSLIVRGVEVGWPRLLYKRIRRADSVLTPAQVEAVTAKLLDRFRAA